MSKDSRGIFYCFWNGRGIKRGRGGTSVCPGMIGGQGKGQKQGKDQCRKEGTLSSPSLPSKNAIIQPRYPPPPPFPVISVRAICKTRNCPRPRPSSLFLSPPFYSPFVDYGLEVSCCIRRRRGRRRPSSTLCLLRA